MNKNIKFRLNFIKILFFKNLKNAACDALKYNDKFWSICEIEEDRFSAVPTKQQYFLCKSFSLHFTEKVWNKHKLCMRPHDTYVLFRTFFSQVNKTFFFQRMVPLRRQYRR